MTMEQKTQEYFIKYNKMFFEGKLNDVQLVWSNRMRVSAAIFYPNKEKPMEKGKICFNRKLLQGRSDKELRETLLVSQRFFNLNPCS